MGQVLREGGGEDAAGEIELHDIRDSTPHGRYGTPKGIVVQIQERDALGGIVERR